MKSYEQRGKRNEWLFTIGSIGGGLLLPVLALYAPIPFGHAATSSFGLGFPSAGGVFVGGALLPSALLRVLLPSVPIMGKDENGRYVVERSMKTRKIHLALATVAYISGAIGWWFATAKP